MGSVLAVMNGFKVMRTPMWVVDGRTSLGNSIRGGRGVSPCRLDV